MKKLIQIVGPSFTNYSLARVNRGMALALAALGTDYDVKLVSNNQYAERDATAQDLANYPELKPLLTSEVDPEGIVIYSNYPKDPSGDHDIVGIKAKLKIIYQAWEESVFPADWVENYNQHADAVICTTSFVRDILYRSGVRVPMLVNFNAIDQKVIDYHETDKYPLKTKKAFKFLHISSGYPRKGTDILAKAYSQEFSDKDDVCLVIKSLPHALNQTPKWVAGAQGRRDCPEFELINQDISEQELAQLFNACSASVYPTRAEGFGLPIAEAMLKRMPVISTGYGAHLDFVTPDSGWLIDYKLVDATESQLNNLGAKWADPDVDHLQKLMRQVYNEINSKEVAAKLERAYQSAQQLTWTATAEKLIEQIEELTPTRKLKGQKRIVISEWNNESGIAEHSSYLHERIQAVFDDTYLASSDVPDLVRADDKRIVRCWVSGETEFTDLLQQVDKSKPQLVHIEYHSAKFKPAALAYLTEQLLNRDLLVVITLHSANEGTGDVRGFEILKQVEQIYVTSQKELQKMQQAGFANVKLMNLGNNQPVKIPVNILKKDLALTDYHPVIATHGLLNERKGVAKLVSATKLLKERYDNPLLLLLSAVSVNNISSGNYAQEIADTINGQGLADNVIHIPDFLEKDQVIALLSATDINVLAYDEIGEGSSGAIQKLIAADRPMLLTDIAMFSEYQELATTLSGNSAEQISDGVQKLLVDEQEKERQSAARAKFLEKHNWYQKSIDLLRDYAEFLT